MAAALDFNSRLTDKRRKEEFEEGKRLLLKILSEATREEQLEMLDAIKEQDLPRYKAVTEPIIMRSVIRQINT